MNIPGGSSQGKGATDVAQGVAARVADDGTIFFLLHSRRALAAARRGAKHLFFSVHRSNSLFRTLSWTSLTARTLTVRGTLGQRAASRRRSDRLRPEKFPDIEIYSGFCALCLLWLFVPRGERHVGALELARGWDRVLDHGGGACCHFYSKNS